MTIVMELIFAAGFTMSVDVTQMYGIKDMETCQQMLKPVIQSYKASSGRCFDGDILSKPVDA